MKMTVTVETPVVRTSRVLQCEGMFDVPQTKTSKLEWVVNMPIEERPWSVGAIIGPSGSGKSTVARAFFGKEMERYNRLEADWKPGTSLLDSFPSSMPIKTVLEALSSVGFASPPAWLRPYSVLSNGEKFRVMMARVLAESGTDEIAVVDEFTSVVDRTVAMAGATAIGKAVRRNGQKFVAVTCHEDIVEWLQPDWTYRPAEQSFAWRSVQSRPRIPLTVYRTTHDAWRLFQRHHYLTHELNKAAFCFVAFADFPGIGERLVAFDSWLPFFGKLKGSESARRAHRIVCLPDYQGLGIGGAVTGFNCAMWKGLGMRAFLGTSHPGFIAQCKRRPDQWKMTRAPGMTAKGNHGIDAKRASDRLMASFEWVGAAHDPKIAKRLLENNWTRL